MFQLKQRVTACSGSPANILGGNVQGAPRCALCTVLLTRAPCCIGMSKSNTSGPPHNWKNRITDVTFR